jgi:hypothetical protein
VVALLLEGFGVADIGLHSVDCKTRPQLDRGTGKLEYLSVSWAFDHSSWGEYFVFYCSCIDMVSLKFVFVDEPTYFEFVTEAVPLNDQTAVEATDSQLTFFCIRTIILIVLNWVDVTWGNLNSHGGQGLYTPRKSLGS